MARRTYVEAHRDGRYEAVCSRCTEMHRPFLTLSRYDVQLEGGSMLRIKPAAAATRGADGGASATASEDPPG
jgi:hypothetical protein